MPNARASAREADINGRWLALRAGGMESRIAWAEAQRQHAIEQINGQAAPAPLPADTWRGRPACTPLDSARWAMEHVDMADVQPADAPCGEAWSLLLLGRQDRVALATAWRTALRAAQAPSAPRAAPRADAQAPEA